MHICEVVPQNAQLFNKAFNALCCFYICQLCINVFFPVQHSLEKSNHINRINDIISTQVFIFLLLGAYILFINPTQVRINYASKFAALCILYNQYMVLSLQKIYLILIKKERMFVGAFVRPETFPHLKRYYHGVRNVY